MIKADDSERAGDPRRFRFTKEGIEKVGYSDGRMGCIAMRAAKPAQRHSEYGRRRVQDGLRGTEEGRQRLEKKEERFMEALVRADERIESLGMRATMRQDEERITSLQPRQEAARRREPPVRGV